MRKYKFFMMAILLSMGILGAQAQDPLGDGESEKSSRKIHSVWKSFDNGCSQLFLDRETVYKCSAIVFGLQIAEKIFPDSNILKYNKVARRVGGGIGIAAGLVVGYFFEVVGSMDAGGLKINWLRYPATIFNGYVYGAAAFSTLITGPRLLFSSSKVPLKKP